jgi:hypothetical protein
VGGSSAFQASAQDETGVVRFRFRLLPWQQKVRELRERRSLIVVNAGVYTGKTVFGGALLLEDMLGRPGATFWWVAGLKFQLDAWWETFQPNARMVGATTKSSPYLYARLPNGAKVYGVSAENVEVISAHHPVAIYGDEVAKWREQAWHLVRVRLLRQDTGKGLFMSSPRPNFWRELVRYGRRGKDDRWGLVTSTTIEAGLIPPSEIESLRRDLPEELFQQEIMARIMDGAGTVFRKVREAAIGAPETSAQPGKTYVIGYDPAKLRDFAVAVVRCENRIVLVERWQEAAYLAQVERVTELAERYNGAVVYIDAGGPGQPVYEQLRERSVTVQDVTFTNQGKEDMVNKLCLKFEKGDLVIPSAEYGEPYNTLVDELTAFERRRTSGGLHYTYSAPDGMHDDCVSALLLACGREENRLPVYFLTPESYEIKFGKPYPGRDGGNWQTILRTR